MSEADRVWIGADPGGKSNFGIAILRSNGEAYTCCVDCADEAVETVRNEVGNTRPSGVGIDAPLWWSSGPSGGRQVDGWLRSMYGLSGGQVQPPNALRGAALVQGVMLVQRIREQFPGLPVTETHPKALLVALEMEEEDAFFQHFHVRPETDGISEHERDALISAVAARQGLKRCWKEDLSKYRFCTEQDPSDYWLHPVHYFWPHRR